MGKSRRVIKKVEPYIYLLPALVYFGIFFFYPFIKTVISTFFSVNANGQIQHFVGLSNYGQVIQDTLFQKSIVNTCIYVVMASPLAIIIALILAILANKKTRASSIYETMFSLTMAMSLSVTAMIFKIMYNPNIGIIDKLIGTKINWLNDPKYAMISISFISVWINIGYNFLFLLSAIRNVPEDVLESAYMDGVNIFQKVKNIILPMISPTVFFLICNSLAKNIIMAGLPIILTDGGPNGSTTTMIYYMYKQAFGNMNYNSAYAAAVLTFIFTSIAMGISFAFEKKAYHRELQRRVFQCCDILGAHTCVLHPETDNSRIDYLKASLKGNLEYFTQVLEETQTSGIKIAIENMCDYGIAPKRKYGAYPEELLELVTAFGDPRIGICWDFEHADIMQQDQRESLLLLGDYLYATHVSDTYSKTDNTLMHVLPMTGTVDWKQVADVLKEINYQGDFCFEVHNFINRIPDEAVPTALKLAFEIGEYLVNL